MGLVNMRSGGGVSWIAYHKSPGCMRLRQDSTRLSPPLCSIRSLIID